MKISLESRHVLVLVSSALLVPLIGEVIGIQRALDRVDDWAVQVSVGRGRFSEAFVRVWSFASGL